MEGLLTDEGVPGGGGRGDTLREKMRRWPRWAPQDGRRPAVGPGGPGAELGWGPVVRCRLGDIVSASLADVIKHHRWVA